MDWNEAVDAMRAGHTVNRRSERWTKVIQESSGSGLAGAGIQESGQEGCRLMHAWTADEKPALVFMGQWSKCLFVPDDHQRRATNWEIVE